MKLSAVSVFLSHMAVFVFGSPPLNDDAPFPSGKLPIDLPNPLATKQAKQKLAVVEKRLQNRLGRPETTGPGIEQVAKGQFVQMAVEGTDNVWTLMGEFSDIKHNQIPEPPAEDNVVRWLPDFSQSYYQDLLFSDKSGAASMTNYFLEQSGGRYKVFGTVEDWVELPKTMHYYGNDDCGSNVCSNVWEFVCDTADAWYDGQIAQGKSPEEVADYLSQLDISDRYDWDGDGVFNEPDGYIDHMQFVHADIGQEAGGSESTIWSHRWYVNYHLIGSAGPSSDYLLGGCEIGQSGIWIGDYTVNPENGGLGVFAHEFGHDLGLPDLYSYIGDNSVGFWDLYDSGGWLGNGQGELGNFPGPMNSWEKLTLGWLNYEVVGYQETKSVRLGPLTSNSKAIQAAILLLPDKQITVSVPVVAPSGTHVYYSGFGNDIRHSMSIDVSIPAIADSVGLTADVWYDIEVDWDYAYVLVNGAPISTSASTDNNPNGQNEGHGITGKSNGWESLSADLSTYKGQTITITVHYWTDSYVINQGLFIDNIKIGNVLEDDAETEGSPAWTFAGFSRVDTATGGVSVSYRNYYFAEYRTYRGSDLYTKLGPYNIYQVDPYLRADHFPYQDGLLVWYWDRSFTDNEVQSNCENGRCGGMLLPVDANPELLLDPREENSMLRGRIQSFDSTFSLDPVDKICISLTPDMETCVGGTAPKPVFDDTLDYWGLSPDVEGYGQIGVDVPKTGTTIKVINTNGLRNFMQIEINGKSV